MMDTVRLGARLRAARKAAGFKTSKAFLKKHKIPASTYSQHESGARMPDEETLTFYSKVFEVSLDWLSQGKGSPFSKPSNAKKNAIEEELLDLSILKNKKNYSLYINQELLTVILSEIISFNEAKPSLSVSVKDALEIYVNVMSSTNTKEARMIAAKRLIKAYKKI